ncbi:PotD/PotF family extracellular solute-binding protein [Bradyrhizobium sp. Pha-3]|uniref:ABC transporter substrate-binding protein n=1 Tax=Bradyrhizobium sp. Pha-3 TaxID=208375 RepID=UPI0035D408B4
MSILQISNSSVDDGLRSTRHVHTMKRGRSVGVQCRSSWFSSRRWSRPQRSRPLWPWEDETVDLADPRSAAIIGKIKATWPNSPFDLIDNWSPVFQSMTKEGWAETVALADVPNLADVPEQFLTKDDKGNIKSIPRSVQGGYFAVRTDRCPIEIRTIEDLLNPRLKGQICWPVTTMNMNVHTVTLALARGGNEFNMDPGWKFLEELAKSGNIGRLYQSGVENTNSMTTGETCITYMSHGALVPLAKRVPIKALTRVDASLKAILSVTGWVVMASSKNKKAAMEFANFTVSKGNSELFNQDIDRIPANQKVKPGANAAPIQFTPQELDKFAYLPDWAYMSTQLDTWVKKFERGHRAETLARLASRRGGH